MALMSTLTGWVAVIALGGGYYYYVKEKQSKPAAPTKQSSRSVEDVKVKKEKAPKKKSSPKTEKDNQATSTSVYVDDGKDEVDNTEFARQLSNLKSGITATAKAKTEKKQKSVKQSKAQEQKVQKPLEKPFIESSDNENATGGDADDDQSSVNSPDLKATAYASPVTNGGVSDMLEAPSPGPSVLKITEATNPQQPKKAKAPATFEAVESKKQRQNRKKAELAKEARAEDEKARRVLEEKQRRTAREAEGRAAKDGSTFMASRAPAESAWVPPTTTPPASSEAKGANGTKPADTHIQLLDTYEQPSKKTEDNSSYSQSEVKDGEWEKALPSEEEQVRIAIEESDEWQTVKGKKPQEKKKPGAKEEKSTADVAAAAPSKNKSTDFSAPNVIKPTGAGQKWNTTTVSVENGVATEKEEEYQDSEWEVA